jgi:hypothetical protein
MFFLNALSIPQTGTPIAVNDEGKPAAAPQDSSKPLLDLGEDSPKPKLAPMVDNSPEPVEV